MNSLQYKMEYKMQYKIESWMKKGTLLRKQLVEIWEEAGFDKKTIFSLKLALEEALRNAVVHGSVDNKNLLVEVTCRISSDSVELIVKDHGKGFDYDNVDDPTTEENLLKPNGRGIFLMKSFMDRVDFFDNGRLVKMVKQVQTVI